MAGFANAKELVNADIDGQSSYSTWRKSPTQVTTQGIWFDLSMSPGFPVPNYYAAAPLVAITLARSTDGGLNHGGSVSPSYKVLRRLMAMEPGSATPLPMPMMLCDYLLYYPFVDEGVTDIQTMTNTNTLTRYTDGAGVRMMAVCVGAHSLAAGITFTVSYTNSSGVAGRTSGVCTLTTAQSVNGTILTSERANAAAVGPFIPLQIGDSGVRSVQSVTFGAADVGLMALVLVKPLAQLSIRGIDAPVEIDYLRDFPVLPRIVDDAYLNFLCVPNGSLSGVAMHGDIMCAWG